MAKGYWIARVDVHNDDGYKPYAAANPGDLQEIRRPLRGARRQIRMSGRRQPLAQRRDRVSRLCRGARLLSLARIPGQHQAAAAAIAIADIVIIEGYDGPQP